MGGEKLTHRARCPTDEETRRALARALAVEIVFASDLMGSGVEWPTTTGLDDETTITALRVIQRKLARTIRPYYGNTPSGH